jgi:HEAT repeat protein
VSSLIREEALEGVIGIGKPATPTLLAGLREENTDVAAGCAEALRQVSNLSAGFLEKLVTQVGSTNPPLWSVWLLGNLSSDLVASRVESLQNFSPQVHYALSILWSFSRSWISRRWEKSPRPFFEETGNV